MPSKNGKEKFLEVPFLSVKTNNFIKAEKSTALLSDLFRDSAPSSLFLCQQKRSGLVFLGHRNKKERNI